MTTSPPVVFSFATWTASFPEFAGLTSDQGQAYFDRACLICANSTTNPVFCAGVLSPLLYLLTSHVAWLNCPKDAMGNPSATGQPPAALVGRISSATQGSVSVQTDMPAQGDSSAMDAYLKQTKYGLEYLAQITQFRTARYVARPTIVGTGVYPGFRRPWGW
jgi:hypothetical protein